MTTTQKFLQQLEQEATTTRKLLSIIPDDKLDWQPHPKSMSIRKLATHIAELPGWITITFDTDRLDLANNPYVPALINSCAELLNFFETSLSKGVASLQNAKDEELHLDWTMCSGSHVISIRSKEDVIRATISQIIHHRAQLGVFLRLLNVPIPGSYGPSADEIPM